MERTTRFELVTSTLEAWSSATELCARKEDKTANVVANPTVHFKYPQVYMSSKWLPDKDLNLDYWFQRPVRYRYAIGQ